MSAKTCIITGAGRGIGRATAIHLTAAGHNVLAVARTAAELDETVKLTAGNPGKCLAHTADVTQREQVEKFVARAKSEFSRIDVLVNNAGAAPLSPVADMSDDAYRRVCAVNNDAIFYACRAAWADLAAVRGTIISISSVASVDPFPGFAVYGASKAWVNTFTHALATEGKSVGIKAFAVGPGPVETQMLRGALPDLPKDETLDPDDIAGLIEWLLDERCRYSSGQTIFIRP